MISVELTTKQNVDFVNVHWLSYMFLDVHWLLLNLHGFHNFHGWFLICIDSYRISPLEIACNNGFYNEFLCLLEYNPKIYDDLILNMINNLFLLDRLNG